MFKQLVSRFVLAAFVVFLWFSPMFASHLEDQNRYFGMWESGDLAYLFAPIVCGALLAVSLSLLVDRWGGRFGRRVWHAAFVFAVGGGVLTLVVHHMAKLRSYHSPLMDAGTHACWVGIALLSGYVFAQQQSRWVPVVRKLCMVFSPAMVVLAWSLLTAGDYASRLDRMPAMDQVPNAQKSFSLVETTYERDQRIDPAAPPVYWFIFDEWSYDLSFQDGKLRPMFPRLAEICKQATVFQDAHTPAPCTELSIPAILYGTDARPTMNHGRLGFTRDGRFAPASEFTSVFALPVFQGYQRVMIGFGLPYGSWVGDQVELCRSHCFFPKPTSVWQAVERSTLDMLQRSPEPVLASLSRKYSPQVPYFDYYRGLEHQLYEEVYWTVTASPARTFAVMHYLLPHKPFIFEGNGELRPATPGIYENTVENYERHLAYLDVTIGQLVGAMKEAGRWDDALVVFTSDHSWRADPLRKTGDHSPTHVPLIIKQPHQQTGHEIHAEFETYRLGQLLADVLGGQAIPDGASPVLASK